MLGKAIALAATKHEGQYDKGGKPYILHPLRVMNSVSHFGDSELMQIAILHDVVEDTNITIADLSAMGFSQRVISGVDALTQRVGEAYSSYIARVKQNIDAIKVKLADLRDNSDITRLKGLRDKDFERTKKYHETFLELEFLLKMKESV